MPLASKQYQDVTPQKWVRIQRAAAGYGLYVAGNAGQAEAFGVQVEWTFEPKQNILQIGIVSAGFLQPQEALDFADRIIQAAIS